MVDTRNGFEVDVGTFDNTVDYRISKFTEFPQVIEEHKADFEGKTVVTFCTGGIRCEKAAIHMQNIGYDHVYQLEGGILKYFEEVGGAHYNGDCFVFDYRTALSRNSRKPRPPSASPAAPWSRHVNSCRRITCRASPARIARPSSKLRMNPLCPA
jgi:predicted sulfurtransferase